MIRINGCNRFHLRDSFNHSCVCLSYGFDCFRNGQGNGRLINYIIDPEAHEHAAALHHVALLLYDCNGKSSGYDPLRHYESIDTSLHVSISTCIYLYMYLSLHVSISFIAHVCVIAAFPMPLVLIVTDVIVWTAGRMPREW